METSVLSPGFGGLLVVEEALVVADKPAGVPTIPARGGAAGESLRERVEAELGARVWVVHRLDRETSGIVLFARSAAGHRALSLAFERRQVEKVYVAFTAGGLDRAERIVDLPLHAARRGKARPARPGEPGAQAARTRFRGLASWRLGDRAVAEVEAVPETGRHHQIRVHLKALGTPVLFDPLYGDRTLVLPSGAPCRRLALHARRLTVPDPESGAPRRFESPLAPDLAALAAWLAARSG
jgi:RluA family pseudouridine synthase